MLPKVIWMLKIRRGGSLLPKTRVQRYNPVSNLQILSTDFIYFFHLLRLDSRCNFERGRNCNQPQPPTQAKMAENYAREPHFAGNHPGRGVAVCYSDSAAV